MSYYSRKVKVHSRKYGTKYIAIESAFGLRWNTLQLLIDGGNRKEKEALLSKYLRKEITAEEARFVGELLLQKKDLSEEEQYEVDKWISIYKEQNCKEHYEVNSYISKHKLWDEFKNIRSLNYHSSNNPVEGIQPTYYRIICEELEITGAGGSSLRDYQKY